MEASSIAFLSGLPGFGTSSKFERVHREHGLAERDERIDVQAGLALELVVENCGPGVGLLCRDEVRAVADQS